MDLGYVLFSPEGRIGRQDFWVGFLILFAAGIFLHIIPVLGTLIWLVSVYCWIVLYAKRLHDFGRSGWWSLVPILASFVGFAALVGMASAMVLGIAAGSAYAYVDQEPWRVLVPTFGGVLGILAVAAAMFLIHLIFLLWVGLSRSDPGPNRFGPPALRPTGPPPAYPPAVQPPPTPPGEPTPPPGVIP